jgi:N-hydroxyarylamine O-acetyltransferase
MRLADYFDRIGYRGGVEPNLETLIAVHRAHLLAVPYENIDVALRRPVTRDPQAAFDKIVTRGRGGWCYEMNGLLGWALEEMGFSVTRMAGGVRRAIMGDVAVGNHLVLRVDLDRPYIADAGFGDGLLEPIALRQGVHVQRDFCFHLEKLDARWWRFHNHQNGSAASFDFVDEPADPALLEAKCQWLQEETSPFVGNVVLQKHTAQGIATMHGRTLRLLQGESIEARDIADGEDYARVLAQTFALPTGDAHALWEKITGAL